MTNESFGAAEQYVPDKCRGCPELVVLATELWSIQQKKERLDELGGLLVGEPGKEFDECIDVFFGDDATEAELRGIKTDTRKKIGSIIEDFDSQGGYPQAIRQKIEENQLACSGVLRMRAKKGGVTYTVGVCTSPGVYEDAPDDLHLASVEVKPVK